MKACSTCKQEKAPAEFSRSISAFDGLQHSCKLCSAEYRVARKAKFVEYNRVYRARHNEAIKARMAARRVRLADRVKAQQAKYYASNREICNLRCVVAQARRRSAEGSHTAQDVIELYRLQKGSCAVCKIALNEKYHVDHVVPLIAHGTNDKDNLQILCGPCNHSKGGKPPITFMQSKGFLI